MFSDSQHPTQENLVAFSLGLLSSKVADDVEGHVRRCESCCNTLVGLNASDTLTEMLLEVNVELTAEKLVSSSDGESAVNHESQTAWDSRDSLLQGHPRYEVKELIGRGGMGQVYLAYHRLMGRLVALKVIDQRFLKNKEAVERFRREVTAAASLNHPNIVTAYDAEEIDGIQFLVMEYVPGLDLAKAVEKNGPYSVRDACALIRQVACGLKYAHERGMIHRDIKPHNLVASLEHGVKILDFGLATLLPNSRLSTRVTQDESELTDAGAVIGSPDFISPEQAANASSSDARSDIYSLGATFYFLLSGKVLFPNRTISEKLRSVKEQVPQSIRHHRKDLPVAVEDVIDRMLRNNPSERYQTAADVIAAIDLIDFESVTRKSKSDLRSKRVILLTAASLVSLIAALVINGKLASFPASTLSGGQQDVLVPRQEDVSDDGIQIEGKIGSGLKFTTSPHQQKHARPLTKDDLKLTQLATYPMPNKFEFANAKVKLGENKQLMLSRKLTRISNGGQMEWSLKNQHELQAKLWRFGKKEQTPESVNLGSSTIFGFVPHSESIFYTTWQNGVEFWNGQTLKREDGHIPHSLREDTVLEPAVSVDGKLIATRPELDQLQFWKIQDRSAISKPLVQASELLDMEFSNDGKWFFSRTRDSVSIWNANGSGELIRTLPHTLAGFPYHEPTKEFVFVKNTTKADKSKMALLTIRSLEKELQVVREIEVDSEVRQVVWLTDTRLLVIGESKFGNKSSHPVYLVSKNGERPQQLKFDAGEWIGGVEVSPDRTHYLFVSFLGTTCWKIGETTPVWARTTHVRGTAHETAWVGKNAVVLNESGGDARILDLASGEELWRKPDVQIVKVQENRIWLGGPEQLEVWEFTLPPNE